jgi:hypothetical protein
MPGKGRGGMPLPVKIKTDDNGNGVLEDGLPVFEFDDGSTSTVDVAGAFKSFDKKTANFNEERDRHSAKLKELKTDLKKFDGVDIEKYNEGMEKIKAIADQKLLDESGAEALKKNMRSIFDEELQGVHKSYKKTMTEKDQFVENLNSIVYDLAIKNKFATNPHFSGESPVTIYPPEDAAKIYGPNFKTEIKGKKLTITAHDNEGNVILSKKKHGEPADFNEAIAQIIDNESKIKPILRSAKTGGPVTRGNLEGGGDSTVHGVGKDKIKAGLEKLYGDRYRQ